MLRLRHAKDGYRDAFDNHKQKNRYSTEKLESWKRALNEASKYTGEIISNQCNEEAALMKVVNWVYKELHVTLNVAKHPVGLDNAEKDFEKEVARQGVGPIQIVGICGMGGAGKTTLARHLYNKQCSIIKRSSFLFDIREASSRRQLHIKQKKLLEDLKVQIADFDNVQDGIEILKRSLKSASVLIVLDDVDHEDQLDALLPARDELGNGSLIIITTREKDVLKKCKDISAIYNIPRLNCSFAKELFCLHAFEQPSPSIGFEELVEQFIKACCGLPLSLKVLGSLLYREKRKEYWRAQLDKLCEVVPKDIKLSLNISYEALDAKEKEMFLDVACFFIGWTTSSVIAIWDGSGWHGMLGWQKLVNKCLVELNEDDNSIRMHDHLRDLGREIANDQSPYRLWSKHQKIQILPQQVIKIRGIQTIAFGDNCDLLQGNIRLNTTQGMRLVPLRLLELKIFIGQGDFINEDCSELSSELLCFHCDRFAHRNLPALKNLRILRLCEAQNLEDLWECHEDVPLQLKQLEIGQAFGLKKISHLQELRLLEELRIHGCVKLKILPSLAEATSLKIFYLKHGNNLEKIESLEGLRSLEELRISCSNLKILPSLGEATSLKIFDLTFWNKLEKIEGLEGLKSLEELTIEFCEELKLLSPASATSLKKINLNHCDKLEKIEGLEGLISLEELKIVVCKELKILPSLARATSLKKLYLSECEKLEKIEGLEGLKSLEELEIAWCTELKTLSSLARATSLKKIDLSGCDKLEKIEGLEHLISLEKLTIAWCTELKTLPSLARATSLKFISLVGYNKWEKIECLEGLKSLEELTIERFPELKTFPIPAEATYLKKIKLIHCSKLEKIEGLESLKSLEKLKLSECTELKTLPSLARATSLKRINLGNCNKWEKIECLEGLKSLRELTISDFPELKTFPIPAEATYLKNILLKGCSKLEKVEGLEGLKSLEELSIWDCTELKTLPIPAEATYLKNIDLKGCSKLEKIEGLEGLKSLKELSIWDCTELKTLPSLAELTCLEIFVLRGCQKVDKVEGLEVLTSLKRLEVRMATMRPCMLKLPEQSERLKRVVVVANRLIGVEASIREIQRWPREEIICTTAVIDLTSLINFFPETMVRCDKEDTTIHSDMPESAANANAILICLIRPSIHPYLCFNFHISPVMHPRWRMGYYKQIMNGEWARMDNLPQESIMLWMGIFPQQSVWLHAERYRIKARIQVDRHVDVDVEVKVEKAQSRAYERLSFVFPTGERVYL